MADDLEFTRAFHEKIPFIRHLGIVIDALEPGVARLSLALKAEHTNSFGSAHGGAIATLIDVAATTATRTLHPGSRGVITIDLTTSFLDTGRNPLMAEARVVRDGRSAVFVETEVRNADGSVVAKSLATCRAIEA